MAWSLHFFLWYNHNRRKMPMPAIFELKRNDDNQFYFHFLDSNGDLLLMSGEYAAREAAEQAIKDVRVGSLMGEQIASGKVPDGDSFFVIKNSAGDVVVKSILFDSQMVFDNAMHKVRDNACIAEISDKT
jgi:uncharacterized protein YegP (UPF0339 family)